jgi:hypothetical protein
LEGWDGSVRFEQNEPDPAQIGIAEIEARKKELV